MSGCYRVTYLGYQEALWEEDKLEEADVLLANVGSGL